MKDKIAEVIEKIYKDFSSYGEDEYGDDQSEERREYADKSAQAILDLIAKELDEVINDNAKKNGNAVPARHIHDGLGKDIKQSMGVE